jgi:non-ribosomal peptide synthetase component F
MIRPHEYGLMFRYGARLDISPQYDGQDSQVKIRITRISITQKEIHNGRQRKEG